MLLVSLICAVPCIWFGWVWFKWFFRVVVSDVYFRKGVGTIAADTGIMALGPGSILLGVWLVADALRALLGGG